MKIICRLTCLFCLTGLVACSNQQIYTGIQKNRQLECERLNGTQYEECIRQYETPYDDYTQERGRLTKTPAPN